MPEDLRRITRTIVPPIKSGTESEPIYTNKADALWDASTNQYYGQAEIPDSGKHGHTKIVRTGPYKMSSDIPTDELIPSTGEN